MGINCGSQVTVCEYPIRFDTYRGCSHGCKYCFAMSKTDIRNIRGLRCIDALKRFTSGDRTVETNWCDWKIPLHWGGMSDPFQPAEREARISLECLEHFRDSQYPVIISTKGSIIAEDPYISLVSESNAVVQVSMVCESYDRLEPGAPTFRDRLGIIEKLASRCKRVIVRAQPYMSNIKNEFIGNLERMRDSGAFGVTVEGMKFKQGRPGFVKVEGDWCYPESLLADHYATIKDACHSVGLAFFCAENRLRPMGDSMSCCGCGDVKGFSGNSYNVVSMINGVDVAPTSKMTEPKTAHCFKSIYQDAGSNEFLKKTSFAEMMANEFKKSTQKKTVYAHSEREVLIFTRWLRSTGIKASEINLLTESQMASHYLCVTPGGQSAVPTPDMFDKMRRSPFLNNVPAYITNIVYRGRLS